jgi:FixJ family two-component response regulator
VTDHAQLIADVLDAQQAVADSEQAARDARTRRMEAMQAALAAGVLNKDLAAALGLSPTRTSRLARGIRR